MTKSSTHFGETFSLRHSVYHINKLDGELITETSLELTFSRVMKRIGFAYSDTMHQLVTFTYMQQSYKDNGLLCVIEGIIEEDDYNALINAARGTINEFSFGYYQETEERIRRQLLIPLAGENGFRVFLRRYHCMLCTLLSNELEEKTGTYVRELPSSSTESKN